MLEYINVLITGESQQLLQREWELRVFVYLTIKVLAWSANTYAAIHLHVLICNNDGDVL